MLPVRRQSALKALLMTGLMPSATAYHLCLHIKPQEWEIGCRSKTSAFNEQLKMVMRLQKLAICPHALMDV